LGERVAYIVCCAFFLYCKGKTCVVKHKKFFGVHAYGV
jgi:hypothetical protein